MYTYVLLNTYSLSESHWFLVQSARGRGCERESEK